MLRGIAAKMKILVTGAGGPAGVCTIKALKKTHFVVAVDMDNLASGLYLAKRAHIVPPANAKEFISKILELCYQEKISLVIPTVSEELIVFSKNIALFEKENIRVAVSNQKSIEIANNKLNTYSFFKGEPYCPEVYSILNPRFPCVAKPVNSRGSRGFYICGDKAALALALQKNGRDYLESVVMEYLNGPEYSVYGLSDLNGQPLVSVVNKRIRALGESKVAKIVLIPEISELANKIAQKLNLVGPWNVQLMGVEGSFKLVEVNPRLAGSLSLIIASGLNYIDLVIKIFTGKKICNDELEYSSDIIMTRYNEEIFLKPEGLIPIV
jgi:carbamoyl-phosphate synthase large subunit